MTTIKALFKDGEMTAVYDDRLEGLLAEPGASSTVRASHVEPAADGTWVADLRPSGGEVVGGFRTRGEAIAFELTWLDNNVIDVASSE